jgi:pimeloyl-ACP methyl ester carboxylesterase
MRDSSRPGTFSDDDFAHYRAAWSQPGAYRAMINWYRAMFRTRLPRPKCPRIEVPTLVLWGANDKFIGREAASLSIDLCENGRLTFFERATHWLPHEEPAAVNTRLLEFFRLEQTRARLSET